MHPERLTTTGQARSGRFSLAWTGATDLGLLREHNEDAFLVEPDLPLFLVSDGMGGHAGGQLASRIVVDDLPALLETRLHALRSRSPRTLRRLLLQSLSEQSRQLRLEGDHGTGFQGMGATVVLALFQNDRASIANLGDSRAYRLRNRRLRRLSRDHSVVAELVEAGQLPPEQAENHPASHLLTSYVGTHENPQPHVTSFSLQPDDRLLLCSDGLTDMIPEPEIARLLLENPQDTETAASALIHAALAAGGHDNTTLVLVHCRPA